MINPQFGQHDIAVIKQMISQQYQLPNYLTSNTSHQQLTNYYLRQARNLYVANLHAVQQKNSFAAKINQLQQENRNRSDFHKKRNRRLGAEIDRLFKCTVGDCSKSYGSQGSLMQHIKLKHSHLANGQHQ